jgi:hypothetical protein
MELSRLWIGMLTRDIEEVGTDSRITLRINSAGVERLNHAFSNTDQMDQERAESNVYELDVRGLGIERNQLNDSSIRLGILGDDAWRPEQVVVWGERQTLFGPEVVPLAIETGITTQLSTDSSEGPSSMRLRLVRHGSGTMPVQRLLMLMVTQGTADDDGIFTDPNPVFGTENPLEIQVVSRNGGLAVLFDIANTRQTDLDSGVANFYTAPVIVPFTKQDLDDRAITLRIKGTDDWWPASFVMFGLDTLAGRPNSLLPLVHLPQWPLGIMRADSSNGVASVTLPLVPSRRIVIDDDVLVAI